MINKEIYRKGKRFYIDGWICLDARYWGFGISSIFNNTQFSRTFIFSLQFLCFDAHIEIWRRKQ